MNLLGWWESLDDAQRGEVAILLGASAISSAAVLPYVIQLQGVDLSKTKLPLPAVVALSVTQSSALFGLAAVSGARLEQRTGLRAPLLRRAVRGYALAGLGSKVRKMVAWGAGAGMMVVVLDQGMRPWLPERLKRAAQRPTALAGLLASWYGGIAEELLLRRGVMTALVAGLAQLRREEIPSDNTLWAGNLGAALLFGAGHLPATAALTALTPVVVARALLLNGLPGLVFGWLYAQEGLETAMGAHFTADIVLHVLLPLVSAIQPVGSDSE